MKLLIASDLHGSATDTNELIKRFNEEKAGQLILLGDIYNPGPRNPITSSYNPLEVARLLNEIKDKLIVVKGNCDSQVDTLISEFSFVEELMLYIAGKKILCTHGHIYNEENLPSSKVDALIYGHFHKGVIFRKNGTLFANAGSVSLPKDESRKSYLTVDDKGIILKSLDGEIIGKEFYDDTKK